jgi:hypothetical protein
MKFTKKDRIQISSTALITSLVLIGLNFLSGTAENSVGIYKSGTISKEKADSLRKEYREFKHTMQIKYINQRSMKDTFAVLEGFEFEASDMDEIVNHNASGDTPDKVIFYFGKDGGFNHGGILNSRKNANMHIIAIGVKNNKLLTGSLHPLTNLMLPPSIKDKADPCPPCNPQ